MSRSVRLDPRKPAAPVSRTRIPGTSPWMGPLCAVRDWMRADGRCPAVQSSLPSGNCGRRCLAFTPAELGAESLEEPTIFEADEVHGVRRTVAADFVADFEFDGALS